LPLEEPSGDDHARRGVATCPAESVVSGHAGWLRYHALGAWIPKTGRGGVWYAPLGPFGTLPTTRAGRPSLLGYTAFEGTHRPASIPANTIGNPNQDAFATLAAQLGGGAPRLALVQPHTEGAWAPVGLVSPTGLLSETEADAGGMLRPSLPALYFGPWYSVRTTPEERETLVVSPGGRIDRVRRTDGVWSREPLATVGLPAGEAAVIGAVVVPDPDAGPDDRRLLVATRGEATGLDPYESGETYTDPYTRMWTAPIAGGSSDRPWLAALAVTAEKIGVDVRVCWPPAGALETDGWTIGGAAASLVVPHFDGDRCAGVFRDTASSLAPDAPGGMIVEGPVPGAGRVRIGLPPGAGTGSRFAGGAALKGGGFASTTGIYGPGGVLTEGLVLNAPYATTTPDLAGHGLWYLVPGRGDNAGLYVVGREGLVQVHDTALPAPVARGITGGVVALVGVRDFFWFRPDGTRLQLHERVSDLAGYVVLADGTACGHGNYSMEPTLACYAPDGTIRDVVVDVAPGRSSGSDVWFSLPDGKLLGQAYTGLWLLDPETLDWTDYGKPAPTGATYDAAGRLFGQVDGVWSELTSTGTVALDLSGYEARVTGLAADEALFVLFLDDGSQARVPRR